MAVARRPRMNLRRILHPTPMNIDGARFTITYAGRQRCSPASVVFGASSLTGGRLALVPGFLSELYIDRIYSRGAIAPREMMDASRAGAALFPAGVPVPTFSAVFHRRSRKARRQPPSDYLVVRPARLMQRRRPSASMTCLRCAILRIDVPLTKPD